MSLSGNIQDVSVADTVQFIHLGGRTGTLTLACGDAKAGIGFHQGRIVNASPPGGKRLGALRIFDERSRPEHGPAPRSPAPELPPAVVMAPLVPASFERSAPTPVHGIPAVSAEARTRLQIVSGDRQLAEQMSQALPEITVARVNLRDAGTPPPGEPPPLVLLDMRRGALALDALSALRRARPRASILVLADSGLRAQQIYEAGAIAVVSGELPLMAACFRSV